MTNGKDRTVLSSLSEEDKLSLSFSFLLLLLLLLLLFAVTNFIVVELGERAKRDFERVKPPEEKPGCDDGDDNDDDGRFKVNRSAKTSTSQQLALSLSFSSLRRGPMMVVVVVVVVVVVMVVVVVVVVLVGVMAVGWNEGSFENVESTLVSRMEMENSGSL
jgi:uncharacterized membrane protein